MSAFTSRRNLPRPERNIEVLDIGGQDVFGAKFGLPHEFLMFGQVKPNREDTSHTGIGNCCRTILIFGG
jgi:hypothetical protein